MTRFIKYNFFFLLTASLFFLGLAGFAFIWIAHNGFPYPGFPLLPAFNRLVVQSQGFIYTFSAACFLLPLFFGLFFLEKRSKSSNSLIFRWIFWGFRFSVAVSITAGSLSIFVFPGAVMLFGWVTYTLGDFLFSSPELNAYPPGQISLYLLGGSLGWISIPFILLAGLWLTSWFIGLLFKSAPQLVYTPQAYKPLF